MTQPRAFRDVIKRDGARAGVDAFLAELGALIAGVLDGPAER